MKVATKPYGNVDFNYPEIPLMPFKLKPGSIRVYQEETPEEAEAESGTAPKEEAPSNPTEISNEINKYAPIPLMNEAKTPKEVLQNFKEQNQTQPIVQPAEPPAPKAPTPIPMAIPESLN